MANVTINGIPLEAPDDWTVLEAAHFLGIEIPTLCHREDLHPYGACRLCVVEVGEAPRSRLVTSCTFRVQEGLRVRTASARVLRARRMIIELLLATAPQSKTIQCLASKWGVHEQRFRQEHEDCILCGLCVRMCAEQMQSGALGFSGRGETRRLGTPFDAHSEICRQCGGCQYVCPVCNLRCTFSEPEKVLCGGCANLTPPCVDKPQFDDMMCFLDPCAACEIERR